MTAALGTRIALRGLSARAPWAAVALGVVATEVFSLLERSREPASAADRTLLGPTLGVVAPLVCYALFEAVYKSDRTTELVEPLGRHGADRRQLAFGVNGTLLAACTTAVALLTALAAVSARGFGDPAVARDVAACLWGGALTGAAYAGLFAVASPFGRRGRIIALVLDWLFGSSAGILAVFWPRAHARNLFGGEPVLDSSQAIGALALATLALGGIALARARETR